MTNYPHSEINQITENAAKFIEENKDYLLKASSILSLPILTIHHESFPEGRKIKPSYKTYQRLLKTAFLCSSFCPATTLNPLLYAFVEIGGNFMTDEETKLRRSKGRDFISPVFSSGVEHTFYLPDFAAVLYKVMMAENKARGSNKLGGVIDYGKDWSTTWEKVRIWVDAEPIEMITFGNECLENLYDAKSYTKLLGRYVERRYWERIMEVQGHSPEEILKIASNRNTYWVTRE